MYFMLILHYSVLYVHCSKSLGRYLPLIGIYFATCTSTKANIQAKWLPILIPQQRLQFARLAALSIYPEIEQHRDPKQTWNPQIWWKQSRILQ